MFVFMYCKRVVNISKINSYFYRVVIVYKCRIIYVIYSVTFSDLLEKPVLRKMYTNQV